MTSEIVNVEDFTGTTDAHLLETIRDFQRRSVEATLLAAKAYAEADRRGLDLSEFNNGWIYFLRKIAGGRLSAEAYVACQSNWNVLKRLEKLPVARQLDVARHPVPVVVVNPDGSLDSKLIHAHKLRAKEVQVVFADDHVRTIPEQQRELEVKRIAVPKSVATVSVDSDPVRQELIVDGKRISVKRLIPHLESLGFHR